MISNVLRDLHFSSNKPLLSADEQDTGILNSKEDNTEGHIRRKKNKKVRRLIQIELMSHATCIYVFFIYINAVTIRLRAIFVTRIL